MKNKIEPMFAADGDSFTCVFAQDPTTGKVDPQLLQKALAAYRKVNNDFAGPL